MRKRRVLQQLTLDGSAVEVASLDLQGTWGGRRKGAGRPRTCGTAPTVTVRISSEVLALIDKDAAYLKSTRSEIIRDMIEDYYLTRE